MTGNIFSRNLTYFFAGLHFVPTRTAPMKSQSFKIQLKAHYHPLKISHALKYPVPLNYLIIIQNLFKY